MPRHNEITYVHESNLQTKIRDNYKWKWQLISHFYEETYKDVKRNLLNIDFSQWEASFQQAAEITNLYLLQLDNFARINDISSQSKFRSTFLEELSIYLFIKNPNIRNWNLSFYNKWIYAGLKMWWDFVVTIIKKDVDFCIAKECSIMIDGRNNTLIIPIVAVEVKTYLDGTMFNEVQFSSLAIKKATANTKTYVLMETNDVGAEKIISARYDKNVDELFVLRENTNSPISYEVLMDYYDQITKDIDAIDIDREIVVPWRLLNVD